MGTATDYIFPKISDRKEARKILEVIGDRGTCDNCRHATYECHSYLGGVNHYYTCSKLEMQIGSESNVPVEKDFYCKYHEGEE